MTILAQALGPGGHFIRFTRDNADDSVMGLMPLLDANVNIQRVFEMRRKTNGLLWKMLRVVLEIG